jgi:hypothetical protein
MKAVALLGAVAVCLTTLGPVSSQPTRAAAVSCTRPRVFAES